MHSRLWLSVGSVLLASCVDVGAAKMNPDGLLGLLGGPPESGPTGQYYPAGEGYCLGAPAPTTTTTYNALISACEKGKQLERALELFEAMQWQRVVPNVITYSVLSSTCVKGNQPQIFETMDHQC